MSSASPTRSPGPAVFAEEFASRGKRDAQGRSLRELDLKTRLFRYPCSYLIDSPAFDALPPEVLSRVKTRLQKILTGEDDSPAYAHLSAEDRQAILEILQATKPEVLGEG